MKCPGYVHAPVEPAGNTSAPRPTRFIRCRFVARTLHVRAGLVTPRCQIGQPSSALDSPPTGACMLLSGSAGGVGGVWRAVAMADSGGNLVPIGRFSAICRLTIKALRHYDDLGLL